jgi:hypothetical protein
MLVSDETTTPAANSTGESQLCVRNFQVAPCCPIEIGLVLICLQRQLRLGLEVQNSGLRSSRALWAHKPRFYRAARA